VGGGTVDVHQDQSLDRKQLPYVGAESKFGLLSTLGKSRGQGGVTQLAVKSIVINLVELHAFHIHQCQKISSRG
jgi:hypothetical protein